MLQITERKKDEAPYIYTGRKEQIRIQSQYSLTEIKP